jgi:hypothetical protein
VHGRRCPEATEKPHYGIGFLKSEQLCRCCPSLYAVVVRSIAAFGVRLIGPSRVCTVRKRMPRFKVKGALERSPTEDLWKHTLSHIPTVFGRLGYLASLRDPHSGAYRHYGFGGTFGKQESEKTLRESHERAFLEWLGLAIHEKYDDLGRYLGALEEPAQSVIDHWLNTRIYRTYVPAAAGEMERELFCRDLETLLEATRIAWAAAGRLS